jgi:hypothetical protein
VIAVLFVFVLAGMAASLATFGGTIHKEHKAAREEVKSFYCAEAALNEAYAHLVEVGEADLLALAYPRTVDTSTYAVTTTLGWVDPDLRLDRIRLRAAGSAGGAPEGVELMVYKVPTGFYRWAAFGDRWVQLNSNSLIDSYDSKDGPYPEKVAWVNDFGNVGSNGDIMMDSNTQVYGDTVAGPTGITDDSASGTLIYGELSNAAVPEMMDPIAIPPIGSMGAYNVAGAQTLPSGDYHFTSVEIGGSLLVQGPARIVVDDLTLRSNAKWVIDATNGPVEIYGTGDFDLRSNSVMTSVAQRSRDVSVFLTGQNLVAPEDTIALDSNSDFTGTIYAPNADLKLDSNFSVFGAIRAGAIELSSNSHLHFDEDLLYDPNIPPVYERVSWRRLSRREVAAFGL